MGGEAKDSRLKLKTASFLNAQYSLYTNEESTTWKVRANKEKNKG